MLSGVGKYLTSTGGGVNGGALANLFSTEASSLFGQAPAGLAGALGLTSLTDLPRAPTAAARVVDDAADSGLSFLKWLLPLLALVALIFYLLRPSARVDDAARRTADNATAAAGRVATATNNAANALTDAAASLGAMVERNLPNMPAIRVPENGIESRLLAFITDSSKAVDTTAWFSFDRIEFDTASATLRPSSNDQLDAIAAILKAYPHVELKVGGYTANVGDDAENLKLSAARAQHTMQALIARGVAAGRLPSEGFGEQHPVASNDTEDGRQRNRRIDVRVTRK